MPNVLLSVVFIWEIRDMFRKNNYLKADLRVIINRYAEYAEYVESSKKG